MVDAETRVRVDRETVLKSLIDAPAGFDPADSVTLVRGNVKVELDMQGEIDWDDYLIQSRLDRVGALDQARAEGFLAGLFMGTTVAMEGMMFPDLVSMYPEDPLAMDDIDADEIVAELEEIEDEDDHVDEWQGLFEVEDTY